MSPNKRKIFASDTSDEDDSVKHRRSSLKVNLSCSENLTDSGNGSLWRTEIENDEKGTDIMQAKRKLSKSKNKYEKKNHRSDFDNEDLQAVNNVKKGTINNDNKIFGVKGGIQLKRLTINLEDISTKEQALETNCKRLKNEILNKTKEIFNKENELSIKTAMILGNEQNYFAGTHDSNVANKSVVMLDTTTSHYPGNKTTVKCADIMSNQQREDQYSNIVTTPTNSNRQRSSERVVDKSKLIQRRLFTDKSKQIEGQTKCKIIDDIILKKNVPLVSVRQSCPNNSPILSGSNRRLSLLRARPKLHSQDQSENHNNTYSTVHSIDIGAPIVCSTFIEDNVISEKKNKSYCNEANSDMDTSRATYTTNKVISMEITEVHGGIRTSEEHVFLQSKKSNTYNNHIKNDKQRKNLEQNKSTTMQKPEGIVSPINKLTIRSNIAHSYTNIANNQDITNLCVDTVAMQASIQEAAVATETRDALQAHECGNKTKNQSNKQHSLSLSDSSNTPRSSLNVNTSLDAVNKVSKMRKSSNYITTTNEGSTALNNQLESVNTTGTSLQMNTSVDSIRKWQRRSHCVGKQLLVQDKNDKDPPGNNSSIDNQYLPTVEDKETNDVDFLENISLIERLRNISVRNQVSNNKLRISEIKDKEEATDIGSNNVQCRDNKRTNKSGDSYVEGTPYPISRSVLIKSQIRYKTQNLESNAGFCNTNLNSMDDEDNDKTKSDVLHSNIPDETSSGTSKAIESDTIILENTPSCNPFVTQNQSMFIEDTPEDETESEIGVKDASQNVECIPVKKGRKKLLPLNETSQLCSITPIDENKCIPKKSAPIKRNKNLKKKHPKRKLTDSKNNTSSITNEQTSINDCTIFENKKRKDKKPRKPKKVVSKKIVIKKFADENVLKILEGKQNKGDQSMEHRDSLDDFVKHRTMLTQWNRYKSQKIVIVTTGLSKGDKSLVKSIVKSLGMAEIELNVSKRTTHVVSTGVRTVNLLRGIIRGCWLITLEWVLKSLENNAWLNPEAFEMKHFSKAVQENRKDRQLFGPSYIPELFSACGLICVEHKTTVPCDTLKELIKTAGGHITENIKLAKIIIGTNGLKETWVIDSITTGELQLTKLYQRK